MQFTLHSGEGSAGSGDCWSMSPFLCRSLVHLQSRSACSSDQEHHSSLAAWAITGATGLRQGAALESSKNKALLLEKRGSLPGASPLGREREAQEVLCGNSRCVMHEPQTISPKTDYLPSSRSGCPEPLPSRYFLSHH